MEKSMTRREMITKGGIVLGGFAAYLAFGASKAAKGEQPAPSDPGIDNGGNPPVDTLGNPIDTKPGKGPNDSNPVVTESLPTIDTVPTTEGTTTTTSTVVESTTTSSTVPQTTTTQGTYLIVELPTTSTEAPTTTAPETVPEVREHTV